MIEPLDILNHVSIDKTALKVNELIEWANEHDDPTGPKTRSMICSACLNPDCVGCRFPLTPTPWKKELEDSSFTLDDLDGDGKYLIPLIKVERIIEGLIKEVIDESTKNPTYLTILSERKQSLIKKYLS